MRGCILFIVFAVSLFAKPLDVQVKARSAILMNADTGAVLFEKHAHIPAYPASITKIATALYVLDGKNPNLDQHYTVSAEALRLKPVKRLGNEPSYWDEVDGTKMGLVIGEKLSLESLLYGLMRMSGNDAANVISESLASSIPGFIDELNEYLQTLGCKNTQFSNPHGLHSEDHFTTAYDMCLIAKKAIRIPKFREIVSNSHYRKPKSNKQPPSDITQANALMKSGKYFYPKAIGIKTGVHSKAQYTLVAAAEHEGRKLIAVLLGCPKRGDRYEDAIRLFDLAFSEEKIERTLIGKDQNFQLTIKGAKEPLSASLKSDLAVAYFPSEEPVCKAFIQWDAIDLPIHQGQKVGQILLKNEEGVVMQTEDLLAKNGVEGTFFFLFKRYLSKRLLW